MTAKIRPLQLPSRIMRQKQILTLDGRLFASAGFLPGDPGAVWEWIRDTVAREQSWQHMFRGGSMRALTDKGVGRQQRLPDLVPRRDVVRRVRALRRRSTYGAQTSATLRKTPIHGAAIVGRSCVQALIAEPALASSLTAGLNRSIWS